MSRDREECVALWQQAQRSPSIIGFNVSGDLAASVSITIDGKTLSAIDVRLWEGPPALRAAEVVFLEMVFVDVPASCEDQQVGDACVASVVSYLREQRLEEFRKRLQEHRQGTVLRRRRGTDVSTVEGGDEKEESWREFLGRQDDAEPRVNLHAVMNIGGAGRRVLACRTSMSPGAAWDLGCLAYPRLFKELTAAELEAEDRSFLACYYSCTICMALIFIIWAMSFFYGLVLKRRGAAPQVFPTEG